MYAEGVTVRADGSIISILNRDRMMIAVGMHSPLNGGYYLIFSLNRSKSAPPSPTKVIKKVLNLNGNLSDWFVFSPICPFYWNGYGHCSPEAIEKQQSLGATQNFPRNERNNISHLIERKEYNLSLSFAFSFHWREKFLSNGTMSFHLKLKRQEKKRNRKSSSPYNNSKNWKIKRNKYILNF